MDNSSPDDNNNNNKPAYKKYVTVFITNSIKTSSIYLLWIFMHYAAAHLYTKYCVPSTTYGFFVSPLLISSPHCKAMRWVMYNGANTIDAMWILLGTYLCSRLFVYNNLTA
jgi:hypothetical protein